MHNPSLLTSSHEAMPSGSAGMHAIWLSLNLFPAISLADRLGLISALQEKPMSREQLSMRLNVQLPALEAICGIMTSIQPPLLVLRSGKLWLTDLARHFLLPESPAYYGAVFQLYWDMPVHASALWKSLRWQLPTERSANPMRQGQCEYTLTTENALVTEQIHCPDLIPETEQTPPFIPTQNELQEQEAAVPWEGSRTTSGRTRLWVDYMKGIAQADASNLARQSALFQDVHRLLDVGGGAGNFALALAEQYPALHCTVLDLPDVCEQAHQLIAQSTAASRVETLAADMFTDPWPQGHDAIFFGNIFHDWQPEHCRLLAERSYQALPMGGRIYLHEMIWNDTKDGPMETALFSFCLTHFTEGGRQYSAPELSAFLMHAGFSDIEVYPLPGYYSLITASKTPL